MNISSSLETWNVGRAFSSPTQKGKFSPVGNISDETLNIVTQTFFPFVMGIMQNRFLQHSCTAGPKPVAIQQKVDDCFWSYVLCIRTINNKKQIPSTTLRAKRNDLFSLPLQKLRSHYHMKRWSKSIQPKDVKGKKYRSLVDKSFIKTFGCVFLDFIKFVIHVRLFKRRLDGISFLILSKFSQLDLTLYLWFYIYNFFS